MVLKTCVKCKQEKEALPAFFVRNRPSYSRGKELPRTYHDTCKVCESEAKRAGWALRRQHNAAYENHLLEETLRMAREREAVRARVLAEEAQLRALMAAEGAQKSG